MDTIAGGDEELFRKYLVYPWVQILMMGVKLRQRQLITIAEHDARKREMEKGKNSGKKKVRKTPVRRR